MEIKESASYARNLAERLMRVPASYGTDQGDVDRLSAIAEEIEMYRAVLARCSELFHEIRMDWTDPRSETREGQQIIADALKAAQ